MSSGLPTTILGVTEDVTADFVSRVFGPLASAVGLDFDATVVQRLTRAGAVLVAKLAMIELAGLLDPLGEEVGLGHRDHEPHRPVPSYRHAGDAMSGDGEVLELCSQLFLAGGRTRTARAPRATRGGVAVRDDVENTVDGLVVKDLVERTQTGRGIVAGHHQEAEAVEVGDQLESHRHALHLAPDRIRPLLAARDQRRDPALSLPFRRGARGERRVV